MFIKRLKPNVYDVFDGNGWDNWTRVQRTKDGEIRVLEGRELHRNTLNKVKARLVK
jgi:hypothetical protein